MWRRVVNGESRTLLVLVSLLVLLVLHFDLERIKINEKRVSKWVNCVSFILGDLEHDFFCDLVNTSSWRAFRNLTSNKQLEN